MFLAQNETENHLGFFYLSPALGNGKSAAQKFFTHICGTPSSNFLRTSRSVASQQSTNDGRKGCSKLQGLPLVLCHWLQRGHTAEYPGVACGKCKEDLD